MWSVMLLAFLFFLGNASFVVVCPGTTRVICDVAALFFVCSAQLRTRYLCTLWTYNKLISPAYACADPSL
jgi:hypothetical protein